MSEPKVLPNHFQCCEVLIKSTSRTCTNAAAFVWEGRRVCRIHAPRKHCAACNKAVPLWEVEEVDIGGAPVPVCPDCKRRHKKDPLSLEKVETVIPRRPIKHGKLCQVCYDMPHRRASPKCKGCGKPPGPAK